MKTNWTVQELIDQLEKVEDKGRLVVNDLYISVNNIEIIDHLICLSYENK